jgi:hypothetical protein
LAVGKAAGQEAQSTRKRGTHAGVRRGLNAPERRALNVKVGMELVHPDHAREVLVNVHEHAVEAVDDNGVHCARMAHGRLCQFSAGRTTGAYKKGAVLRSRWKVSTASEPWPIMVSSATNTRLLLILFFR